ncbi:MAG: TIGR01212 family radical SAM protein [Bacilli bacterium]
MSNKLSPFKYSNDNKRYHTFNYYLRSKYHQKLFKVSLNAGLGCPNRNNQISMGGCSFCSASGSGDFAGNVQDSLLDQFEDIRLKMHQKWPTGKYIAYFQAYTNTYAPLPQLKEMYDPFMKMDDVYILDIATRPDCLEDDVIAYLHQLSLEKEVWVELGLQTTYDESAASFNRGYNYDVFLKTINKLALTNIKVCVHLINGLPLETKEMMLNNVKRIAHLPIHALKIHMLHIIQRTPMGLSYLQKPWAMLELDEYVALVAQQLSILPPHIIIARLTGDALKEDLIAPTWTLNKTNVLNSIDKYLNKHNMMQGMAYKGGL